MSEPTSTGAPRHRILLAFAAVYLIWGSTYLAIRLAIETLPPFLMVAARLVVAGALLYAFARWTGQGRPTLRHWRSAFVLGGLLLFAGNGGLTWAETRVPTGLAALVVSMVPLWVVLLEGIGPRAVRTGRPSRPVLVGVLLGLGGMVILLGPGRFAGGARVDLAGAGVLLVGSLCWAFGSLLSRKLPLPDGRMLGTAMEMLVGGGLLLLFGLATGETARLDLGTVTLASVGGLLYLVVFGSLIAFSAYGYLLAHVPAPKVATYAYVNPLVALLLGWAFLGEALSVRTLLAGVAILGAVALITSFRRPSPATAASRPPSDDAPEPEPATFPATLPAAEEPLALACTGGGSGAPIDELRC